MKDRSGAFDDFSQAIRRGGTHPVLRLARAELSYLLGHYGLAVMDYTAALEHPYTEARTPELAEEMQHRALLGRAESHWAAGDLDAAQADCDRLPDDFVRAWFLNRRDYSKHDILAKIRQARGG